MTPLNHINENQGTLGYFSLSQFHVHQVLKLEDSEGSQIISSWANLEG